MSIMFMILSLGARAGAAEVRSFPPQAPAQLRAIVRSFLTSGAPPAVLEWVTYREIDAVGLIAGALDEVDTLLRDGAPGPSTQRLTKILDWIADLPLPARLSELERGTLRRALRPFLARSRESKIFLTAVGLYRRLDLWDENDVDFVIDEIPRATGLLDHYEMIRRIASVMGPGELERLTAAILTNPGNPILRFTLLDEIGTLAERDHAATLLGVRNAFKPRIGHVPNDRERGERRAYLRLLERWQGRLAEGDARVGAALAQLAKTSDTPVEVAFAERFGAGRLPVEPSPLRLISPDPLGLELPEVPGENVIRLSSCGRWLEATRRKK